MMKRLLCAMLALCLCAGCALAEADKGFTLWFDGEFSLDLPAGWASYPVPEEAAKAGIQFMLGDAEAARLLYVQRQRVPGIVDCDALRAALEAREDCGKVQELALNGHAFATFIMSAANVSGCATVLNGAVLTFLFTPQDDSDYIMQVAEIMGSFRTA